MFIIALIQKWEDYGEKNISQSFWLHELSVFNLPMIEYKLIL